MAESNVPLERGPLKLNAAELAVVFPRPAPQVPPEASLPEGLSRASCKTELGADADRESTGPPSVESVLVTLQAMEQPALASMLATVRATSALHIATLGSLVIYCAGTAATVIAAAGLVFWLNDGLFGTRQIAASLAGIALFWACVLVPQIMGAQLSRARPGLAEWFAVNLVAIRSWGDAVLAHSPLFDHVDGDAACPCSRCCSGVIAWSFWERVIRIVPMHLFSAFAIFTMAWTPLVHFGSAFWSSWWGITLGSFLVIFDVVYNAGVVVSRLPGPSSAEVALATRIYLRASFRAMRDLLERSRSLLLHTGDQMGPPDDHRNDEPGDSAFNGQELYVQLHFSYKRRWKLLGSQSAFTNFYTGITLSLFPASILAAIIINLAAGTCVTAWSILSFLTVIYTLASDIASLPALNSQIDALARLYSDARVSIRAMLAEAAHLPEGNPVRSAAARELKAHAELLAVFGDVEGLRATFVGIPITWGLAKTLAVTMITLAVALWSVLRGIGVVFTMQSVCPGV
ncbi:hypothetical protein DFJ74DRAFT_478730 [Hyaloraphidium curvatum]|nr:hypothetical protein DFJ74DRAFT_478730 [Hyaloraphidium curvatum]